ncbi:MAG TPA: endolytic transglycosylase MltG, partial [Gaiellaceae bacterium]|nr:endolytic transglycosylase MltG [Gaiellaceae bacterium]
PYDVLIIASMVEKETVVPAERRLVAAVIYNRLRLGMPLGIDATIRYGRNVPGTEPLRQSDIVSDDPYNTRRRPGLPPTPIANPGLAAIRAAARPARVGYLYFVRKPDRRHHFFTASEAVFCQKSLEYGYGGC